MKNRIEVPQNTPNLPLKRGFELKQLLSHHPLLRDRTLGIKIDNKAVMPQNPPLDAHPNKTHPREEKTALPLALHQMDRIPPLLPTTGVKLQSQKVLPQRTKRI